MSDPAASRRLMPSVDRLCSARENDGTSFCATCRRGYQATAAVFPCYRFRESVRMIGAVLVGRPTQPQQPNHWFAEPDLPTEPFPVIASDLDTGPMSVSGPT